MDAFPAYFPLADRTVVIAGDGALAEAKARLFVGSPATIVRLSGDAAFDPAAYAGAVLAFVASEEPAVRRRAHSAAKAAGVLVNVVDDPKLCDFTTPAVIDRGAVVAAVGTGGAAPLLAAMLRNDIEARVPPGAGRVAALLQSLQGEVRAALPDTPARRAFLRRVLTGPAADAALRGEMDLAQRLLRAALAEAKGQRAQGRVCVLASAASADLLSLRAARRLAEADVLAFGRDVGDDVAALARRDAKRIDAAACDLAALAAAGALVVIMPAPAPSALAALVAAGVAVEVLTAGGAEP
jgi:precorrin-2 dehydrogenase/sirohydrochlorin ferrochelatase